MKAVMTVVICGVSEKTSKAWAKINARPADEASEARGVHGAWLINGPKDLEKGKSYNCVLAIADNNAWTSKDGKRHGGGDVVAEFIRMTDAVKP